MMDILHGDQKESLICDMIINGVNDAKVSEKLMEIPTHQLTLVKVIQLCQHIEVTAAHLKSLDKLRYVTVIKGCRWVSDVQVKCFSEK